MPIAVVTGSSSGIGRATALQLAANGYSLVLHALRNLRGLHETARMAAESNVSVRCITADVACPDACRDLVQAAFAWQNGVDVWINNAGADILTTAARHQSVEQRLKMLLDVDVQGTIRLSRLVAKAMQAKRKRRPAMLPAIVNIGWDQAEQGMEGDAGQLFCTAKAAVMAFTRAFAMSTAPSIRVNCVAPGWIRTEWGQTQQGSYWDRRARSQCLLDRWGTAEDVAAVIAWLASPSAQFVNGQCIAINGGQRSYPESPS